MISKSTIDNIFSISQIEEVVGEFVNLRKRGANLLGLCPFHNEKTPSFTVSPAKNIYKCFGCGRGGNSVQFLMEHEHLTYPESLRFLAQKYKIEIEETADPRSREEKQVSESYFVINEFAQQFFKTQLFETEEGKQIALPYFKERGLLEKTINNFGLGYSPLKASFTELALKKDYNIEFLKTLGLTNRGNYDFYKGRVIFPFYNLSGKVIGFGGRILGAQKGPKYVNSPESEIYNKKKTLYGLFQARTAIRKEENLFLVEGYTDVLSLFQAGIENVVASSGTSLTEEQIMMIKRFTKNVTILYDGDPAGIKAALRGIDLILEKDLNVKIVLLPEGEDPDSWVRSQGKDDFLKYIATEEMDFIHFKINLISKESKDDPIKKTELLRDIVESLSKIPDQLKRSIYIQKCALQLNVDEKILNSEINKRIRQTLLKQRFRDQNRAQRNLEQPGGKLEDKQDGATPSKESQSNLIVDDEYQEKDIVRILVTAGDVEIELDNQKIRIGPYLLENISEIMDAFDNELYKEIILICQAKIENGDKIEPSFFLYHENERIQRLAIDLSTSPHTYSENWITKWEIDLQTQPMPENNFKKDSFQSILRFKLRKINKMIKENQSDLNLASENKDDAKLVLHMKVHNHLTKLRNDIAKELNTVII